MTRFEKVSPTVERFWYSVDALVFAAARISWMLWPPVEKKQPRKRQVETTCKKLRDALGISGGSPLANKQLREHSQHFAERMERWVSRPRNRDAMDSDVFPVREIRGWKVSEALRTFDPETWALYLMGEKLELKPIVASVTELQARLDMQSPPVDLLSPERRI